MKQNKFKEQLMQLCLAAVFAALTFLGTFFFKIPFGTGGYLHLGDAFILIAAVLIKKPYALGAAAIGAGLADIIGGFAAWAPFTMIIKAAMVLCFLLVKSNNILSFAAIASAVVAGIVNILGYYLAEWILYGNFIAPIASVPWNALQSLFGIVIFCLAGFVFKAPPIKKMIDRIK
ncbi:MAG: TIGR04002 family protein [Clostridia bacterium]|nr:TIGR04002 family protein [Clostridia bacterium]